MTNKLNHRVDENEGAGATDTGRAVHNGRSVALAVEDVQSGVALVEKGEEMARFARLAEVGPVDKVHVQELSTLARHAVLALEHARHELVLVVDLLAHARHSKRAECERRRRRRRRRLLSFATRGAQLLSARQARIVHVTLELRAMQSFEQSMFVCFMYEVVCARVCVCVCVGHLQRLSRTSD